MAVDGGYACSLLRIAIHFPSSNSWASGLAGEDEVVYPLVSVFAESDVLVSCPASCG